MSITIDYSMPGMVRIRCGDEEVAVPLQPQANTTTLRVEPAAKPAVEPVPAPAPVTEPKPKPDTQGEMPDREPIWRIGLPPPMPGVMGIVTIAGHRSRPRRTSVIWSSVTVRTLPVTTIVASSPLALAAQFAQWRESMGLMAESPLLLDITVSPQYRRTQIDVASLQELIDDPVSGVDAIRLNYLPDAGED